MLQSTEAVVCNVWLWAKFVLPAFQCLLFCFAYFFDIRVQSFHSDTAQYEPCRQACVFNRSFSIDRCMHCINVRRLCVHTGVPCAVLNKPIVCTDDQYKTIIMLISTVVESVLWHCWLVVRKSIRPEWWHVGVVICLEWGADCLHMVQLMPLHPKTPSSLASFKSRLVLPFWCRLTHIVPERGR